MGRRSNVDSIEAKIKKAQHKVSVTCDRYEAATAELKALLAKREEVRKEELFEAVKKSKRNYEDILKYIRNK